MKKFILIAVLSLLVIGLSAQNNEHAMAKAVETIILEGSDSRVVDEFVEEIYEKHCKTASLATRIAKAYYMYSENPDTKERIFGRNEPDTALKYVQRAVALDPKYPDSYILASDILQYRGGEEGRKKAMEWLDRGVAANPTDASLYVASAKLLAYVDPVAAAAKLNLLKERDPNFDVDLELGRLYYNIFDHGGTQEERQAFIEKQVDHYKNVDIEKMNAGDIGAYANALTFSDSHDIAKCFEVTDYGIKKFPDDFAIRQYHFYSLWGLNRWDEAIASAKRLFEMGDSTKITQIHYYRYALCFKGANRYDEAIAEFEKMKQNPIVTDYYRNLADQQETVVIQSKVNKFASDGNYQQALNILKPNIEKYNSSGKQNDNLCLAHGDLYRTWAGKLEGADQEEKYLEADKIYAAAIPGSKDNKLVFCNRRYSVLIQLDKSAEKGLAVPAIKEMEAIAAVEAKEDPDVYKRLYGQFIYMRAYYVNTSNYAEAVNYAEKILDINPTDQGSLEVLRVFGNKVGKKR